MDETPSPQLQFCPAICFLCRHYLSLTCSIHSLPRPVGIPSFFSPPLPLVNIYNLSLFPSDTRNQSPFILQSFVSCSLQSLALDQHLVSHPRLQLHLYANPLPQLILLISHAPASCLWFWPGSRSLRFADLVFPQAAARRFSPRPCILLPLTHTLFSFPFPPSSAGHSFVRASSHRACPRGRFSQRRLASGLGKLPGRDEERK